MAGIDGNRQNPGREKTRIKSTSDAGFGSFLHFLIPVLRSPAGLEPATL